MYVSIIHGLALLAKLKLWESPNVKHFECNLCQIIFYWTGVICSIDQQWTWNETFLSICLICKQWKTKNNFAVWIQTYCCSLSLGNSRVYRWMFCSANVVTFHGSCYLAFAETSKIAKPKAARTMMDFKAKLRSKSHC